jgi:hypothetical protein
MLDYARRETGLGEVPQQQLHLRCGQELITNIQHPLCSVADICEREHTPHHQPLIDYSCGMPCILENQ